jgi:ABC-type sulfate/molybdate transport systems ATPase subunit
VALARAFATDPVLLLLDEPFSALDTETRAAIVPELRDRLLERGAAAILVTHDIAEAFAFAPRLALLDGGKLIADGNVRDLTLRPPSRRVASLLGVENVMPGRVVAYERGFGTVEIAPGMRLLATCKEALIPPTEVGVAIPATMIRLFPSSASATEGWNAVPAQVESVLAQPGWDQVTLRAARSQLLVRTAWEQEGFRWAPGDMLTASFPPEAAWIIPGTGSERPTAG